MRTEAKLLAVVIVLVVLPTAVLSLLMARVVENWHLILERQMEATARATLRGVREAWAAELALARTQLLNGVAAALTPTPASSRRLTRFVAGYRFSNEWVEQVWVWQPPDRWVYPAPVATSETARLTGEAVAEELILGSSPPGLLTEGDPWRAAWRKAERLQFQYGEWTAAAQEYEQLLQRADLPSAWRCEARLRLAQCRRRTGRQAEAIELLRQMAEECAGAGGDLATGPRDEEGYLFALLAARQLTDLYLEQNQPAAALENEVALLGQVVANYDVLVPRQREALLDHSSRMFPSLLALTRDTGALAARIAAWRSELREREHARAVTEADRLAVRQALVTRLRLGAEGRPGREEWVTTEAGVFWVLPGGDEAQSMVAARVNAEALGRRLQRVMARAAERADLRLQVTAVGEALETSGGSMTPLAYEALAPPFAQAALAAWPRDPAGLQASARWQSRLLGWAMALLAAGIVLGVWMLFRQAAEALRQARLRTELVASVSHDLRTPLSSMRVLVESLCLGRVTDPEKQQRFLEAVLRECDRLGRLTDRALYFIRFGQGALRYHLTPGDVGALVKNTVTSFGAGFPAGDVELGVAVEPQLPSVRFDPGALEQVVTNLLDNAVKYSAGTKRVDVAVRPWANGRAVAVTVRDYGVGIPRREQRRIFRPYYRGANRQLAGGVGLGLAVCRHIVRAHGGRIEVESAPGQGTTFRVVLPATLSPGQ